jgi:hypothetical protein
MTIQLDDSLPQDSPKEFTYDVGNFKITVKRQDPYGFFYLTQDKGKLPDEYTGAYTSLYEVDRVIREYNTKVKLKNKE